MDSKADIAVIGECLIELSANGTLADTSTLNKYFGGDTVTTAVTIARLGGHVSYITKVGNDGFSEFILSSLQKENIDTSMIKTNDEQNNEKEEENNKNETNKSEEKTEQNNTKNEEERKQEYKEEQLSTFSTKIYSKDSERQNNINITCNTFLL